MAGEAVWPITYKGRRFKVNDRDRVLYELVKAGEITEDQLRRFQETIPNDAIAAETAVAVREVQFRPSGGGSWAPETEAKINKIVAEPRPTLSGEKGSSGEKTYRITVDGKKMKVNSRDHYLYRRYNRGELTMEEVRRWQGDVSAGANAQETINTMRGFYQKEREAERETEAEAGKVTQEEYNAMSPEERAVSKFDVSEDAAEAMLKLMRAGLITWNELQTLTFIADEEWDAEGIYGLAIEEFDIPDGEWASKAPSQNIMGLEELERRRPNFGERARQFDRWSRRGERDRELGGDTSLFGGAWDKFTAEVPRVEKSKALMQAIEDLPEGSISDKDRASAIHDAERFRWDEVNETIGDARKYIDDEVALAAFDTALSMPDTVEEMEAKETILEGVPTGEDRQAEISAYETMQTEGGFYATDIPTVADIQLDSLRDYAEYIGIIGPDDQAPLNVVVDERLQTPIEGDVPGNVFYDFATGQEVSAAYYERLMQGKLSIERGYLDTVGLGGVQDQYKDFILGQYAGEDMPTSWTQRYGEAAKEKMRSGRLAETTFRAFERDQQPMFAPSQMIGTFDPRLPWERPTNNFLPGSARVMWDNMTGGDRRRYEREWRDKGLYEIYDDKGRPVYTNPDQEGVSIALLNSTLAVAQGTDKDPFSSIAYLGAEVDRQNALNQAHLAAEQSRASAMAPKKTPFSIPSGLRSIPDYKTIAQDVKTRFRDRVGRDPSTLELDRLSGELTGYHQRANQELIKLAYRSWQGDDTAVMDGADLERIGDPLSQTTFDIEMDWANEINLNERQEVNATSMKRMMSATGVGESFGLGPAAGGENIVRS